MASQESGFGALVWRYRPAVAFFVSTLAFGCGLYYAHSTASNLDATSTKTRADKLHRSNAVRHPRRPRSINTQMLHSESNAEDDCPISPMSLSKSFNYGNFTTTRPNGDRIEIPMINGDLPYPSDLMSRFRVPYAEAVQLREVIETAFLDAFFARTMPPGAIVPVSERSRQHIISELVLAGDYQPNHIIASLDRYSTGQLEDHPDRLEQQHRAREDAPSPQSARDMEPPTMIDVTQAVSQPNNPILNSDPQDQEASPSIRETIHDGNISEHSSHVDTDVDLSKKGQNLLGLIYTIAEEQAKKEGYVHRRVTCNSCNVMPIRGIRYRCANCVDFDLCEQCEALQVHPRTHLFYKVRIPAPFLGNPRKPQPVWYPGKPSSIMYPLSKEDKEKFCQQSGFQLPEVEALWEQFRCLAGTEWLSDPMHYCLAISRHTFDRCFIPKSLTRPPPPNLIYDRIFAFYDTDGNGLIGFEEFLMGIACLQNKGKEDRMKRIFDGYDIDRNGLVERKDFQRIFKALFGLHKELAKDIIARLHDDEYDDDEARNIITSNQAISSAFAGSIPPGEPRNGTDEKVPDQFGDYVLKDDSTEIITDDAKKHPLSETLGIEFPGIEEDHGQDILFEVIEDGINELLDPLFRLREDLADKVEVTSEERKRFSEQINRIIDAGFSAQMKPLLHRFEQKWRTNTRMTVNETPGEADKLLQYLETSEQFQDFDPSNQATSMPEPSAESQSDHHTRLSTPELPGSSKTDEDSVPDMDGENLAEVRRVFDSSNAELNGRGFRDVARNMDNLPELALNMLERRRYRSRSQRRMDDDLWRGAMRRLSSSDESLSDAQTTNLVFDHNEWDITIHGDHGKDVDASVAPDSTKNDNLDQPSAYEYRLVDRPTESTLPQNRLTEIEAALEEFESAAPLSLTHTPSEAPTTLPSSLPPQPQRPDPPYSYPSESQTPTHNPNGEVKHRFVRHGSMFGLRPRTPPSLDRLKELALHELLKAQAAKRGGWGRIAWEEFEEIMKGPKGQALGFVGNWVEMAII